MDIGFIIPIGILLLFSYFYFAGKRRHPKEEGLTPLFEEQCAGRIDGIYFTGMFLRHTIYEDFLVLAYGKVCHIIKFDEIEYIELKEGLFSIKLIIYFKVQ